MIEQFLVVIPRNTDFLLAKLPPGKIFVEKDFPEPIQCQQTFLRKYQTIFAYLKQSKTMLEASYLKEVERTLKAGRTIKEMNPACDFAREVLCLSH